MMALLTLWKTINSGRSSPITKILFGALISLWALLPACASSPLIAAENLEEPPTHGRILLWHGWNDKDAAALDLTLRQFREANPGSKILSVFVPPEELFDQYVTSAPQGLGPDVLIGS
ncbi:MAG TPA: hypothetical protein VLS48_01775, partial [Anaerolineales bacterium]|nr:hypothetical protein [Anaerolineales bacterium]